MIKDDTPILLIDDDEDLLSSYKLVLKTQGYSSVSSCSDSAQALRFLSSSGAALVVLDLNMPNLSGEELLPRLRGFDAGLQIIVVTGLGSAETAVRCMKAGADDYLVKPVGKDRFISAIAKALEKRQLLRENRELAASLLSGRLRDPEIFSAIRTRSPKLRAIFQYVEAVAASPKPLLITGENGTGKELLARAYYRSSGLKGAFIAFNAAGVDDTFFADSLFGHAKGAYTGADSPRAGLVERAAGGVLFLDEIGDLSPASQLKLLRLIQEGEYYPVGDDRPKQAAIRIVAATNAMLETKQREGQFREDLYYRLNFHLVRLPPLRERREDIPLLLFYFLERSSKELGKEVTTLPPGLLDRLLEYSFPGNIRELESLVYDAVAAGSGRVLDGERILSRLRSDSFMAAPALPPALSPLLGETTADSAWTMDEERPLPSLEELEASLIEEALRRGEGNQSTAAKLIGVAQSTISRYLKKRQPNKTSGSSLP